MIRMNDLFDERGLRISVSRSVCPERPRKEAPIQLGVLVCPGRGQTFELTGPRRRRFKRRRI
jgi:hypothetical protein